MIERISTEQNLTRSTAIAAPLPKDSPSFILGAKNKSYKYQYSNIYFLRLRILRPFVESASAKRWNSVEGGPQLVPRVLDVENGQQCYIVGTVYLDMPTKPNILEDIGKDQSLPIIPPPDKIYCPEDTVHLEDESGRIKLVGGPLKEVTLTTGVVIAALGEENASGDFEISDLCYCGMAPNAARDQDEMEVDRPAADGEWIALVSGLDIGSKKANSKHDIRVQLLVEYLTDEMGASTNQEEGAKIARLIIAGDSLHPMDPITDLDNLNPVRQNKNKSQPLITTALHPLEALCDHLFDIAQSMPVHIMPGENDPSSITLPQQPMPRAMLGEAKKFDSFKCETNPTYMAFGDCSILGSSGQPLTDMCRYLPDPLEPNEFFQGGPPGSLRLRLLETTLNCRHMAPTAPDTLHCYPYFISDPFILYHTPNLYFHGNQPRLETTLLRNEEGTVCRVVCLPRFVDTGELVLFNTSTLQIKVVTFDAHGMGKEDMPG